MRKEALILAITGAIVAFTIGATKVAKTLLQESAKAEVTQETTESKEAETEAESESTSESKETETEAVTEAETPEDTSAAILGWTADDYDLFIRVVYAEAGNQDAMGKRLVADVILNRVASDAFPDTVEGVLLQKNQFTCVSTGAIWCYTPDEETKEAVHGELVLGSMDPEIVFFQAGGFSAYGTPAYKYGDHYFSTL